MKLGLALLVYGIMVFAAFIGFLMVAIHFINKFW